ncbi:MAG: UvrD-helicase domain-containing protein [Longimicrobiales bacterium]|nr:UvrD-helicase domain-containing protein [Longimicrobiales bacterium]
MSDPKVLAFPLPDAGARRRIQEDLDTNLLVEAGAGSGKTTELVNRMVALVATGTATVDEIAAVTFTRKAAAELRERFQSRLERDVRVAETPPEVTERLRAALEDIDRAFLGTIHAFCARLLRERPLEVGLDPAFEELTAEERRGFYARYWEAHLERLARDADPFLEELNAAGLGTGLLFGLFEKLAENPDVGFPAPEEAAPTGAEIGAVRRELEALVRTGMELMPDRAPDMGWDSLQKKIRSAAFTLDVTGWKHPGDFFEALTLLCKDGPTGHVITQNRWRSAALARDLRDRADAFGVGDTRAHRLLDRWYAHRYALALRLAQRAAVDFAEHRRRAGRLDFQDLLLLAARLLRGSAEVRVELGRRYRRLLVDEFQDTDPLQAEIVLLLASEPPEPAGDASWRTAVPRPGALFVVGDPKQSIYRFRRADIQLYEFVKGRFADFGAVVELTSNFRSRPRIGDLVNQVFDHPDFFPAQATSEQARFEPLNTRPGASPSPAEGVFWYAVAPERDAAPAVAEDDAARLAGWIRRRVDAGERSPGDFLVLTRLTRGLATYARALEEHGLPVQVTGAGVGVEEELEELLALIECMIDPTDPVKVVTVLVGLFFGLDHERLLAHRLARGDFEIIRLPEAGQAEVRAALGTLHGWWRSASRQPADVFLGRVVPELGLLPLAAAGDLGSLRAGALVFALDAVRGAALAGDASLPGALDALRAALDARESEAPLEPGRSDVVRLMNLHQAKGLEAPVVVLADPSRSARRPREMHVERLDDGSAVGYLRVAEKRSEQWASARLLARPSEWPGKEAAEARFEAAEEVRLLYVAATRARDELVVSRWPAKAKMSPWAALDGWIQENGQELVLEVRAPAPRDELAPDPSELARRVDSAARALTALAEPSFRHVSVTDVAKGAGVERPAGPRGEDAAGGDARFRGYSWGSAVHGALAAAAADDSEVGLRAACRALLVEHARPLDDHGEPREMEELMALVRAVRGSELWRRAAASSRILAEVPFAVPGVTRPPPRPRAEPEQVPPGEDAGRALRQLDLFGGHPHGAQQQAAVPEEAEEDPALPSVLEGVVDLAFREKGGWVIADYKTDVGTDPDFPARLDAYRRQVDLYAEAWTRLTGEPVKERVLFFTAQGRVEAW